MLVVQGEILLKIWDILSDVPNAGGMLSWPRPSRISPSIGAPTRLR